jgi:hypothetical protein
MLSIFGEYAAAKSRRCGEIVLGRVRDAGFSLRESTVECLGAGDIAPGTPLPYAREDLREVVLRVSVSDPSKEAVERFSRELMPLVTSGPPGTTGYAEGRPRVHPVFRYWPCLVDRGAVTPSVSIVRT